MNHEKTVIAARGKWRGILMNLGVPEDVLIDRHGDCPLCDGKKKFRWDNKEGSGSYICVCSAGDGMKLAMDFTGDSFATVASRIDGIIGNIKPDPEGSIGAQVSEDDARAICRQIWLNSQPVEPGDLVHTYLAERGVDEALYPKALRFAKALKDGDGGVRPAMVALVGVPGQDRFVAMHRTFLRPDGKAKAEMEAPRKMTPGVLPRGACVQLSEYTGGPLGVAEGIETALSASVLFQMPVWSVLNTALMKSWVPPEGCTEVVVFGDNDPKFGGQAAAYELAHKLAVRRVSVTVTLPREVGTDWNDVLCQGLVF